MKPEPYDICDECACDIQDEGGVRHLDGSPVCTSCFDKAMDAEAETEK